MRREVRVEKRKFPSRLVSRWDAFILQEDAIGTWLFSPKRSIHYLSSGDEWEVPFNGIQLLPHNKWWAVWWWDDPTGPWCAADVATPPKFQDDVWSYEDLEIDVVGSPQGFEMVVDEDEFDEAKRAVPFPSELVTKALASRDEIVGIMKLKTAPFDQQPWIRLQRLRVET